MTILTSAPGDDPITVESVFNAPRDKVYAAWTDPALLRQWFGYRPGSTKAVSIDLRIGGHWQCLMQQSETGRRWFGGEYLHIEAGRRLDFTWTHVEESADGRREETPPSTVSLTFEDQAGGTRVRLVHTGIAASEALANVNNGWSACFNSLGQFMLSRIAA